MNDLQTEILKILETLDSICKDNNIEYALHGGTFLGAVRHEGFIPWDDDVDVILSRDNYNKLISVLLDKNNLPEGYFFQSIQNSKKYFNSTPKLRNNSMDIYERVPKTQEPYAGPWVDLFVWDNVPDNEEELKKFFKKLKRIDFWIFVLTYVQYDPERTGIVNILKGVVQKFNELFHPLYFFIPGILERRDRLSQSYNHVETKRKGTNNYVFHRNLEEYKTEIINAESLKDFKLYNFESLKLPAYKHYDNVLKTFFGDYMKIPNAIDRKTHNIIKG